MSFCLATEEIILREGEVDLLRFLLAFDLEAIAFSLEVWDGVDVAVVVSGVADRLDSLVDKCPLRGWLLVLQRLLLKALFPPPVT